MSDEKLFDEDGNEVEGAMTAEQVEAKLDEAKAQAQEEVDKQLEESQKAIDEEKEEIQKELDDVREELEKEKAKDKNFSNLRKSKEESSEKVKELESKVEELSKGIKEKEIEDNNRLIDSAISAKAGDDKELKEKMKVCFNKFTKPQNIEELKELVESAYILATGGQSVNPLTGSAISGAGGVEPKPDVSGTGKGIKMTEAGKAAGKAAGISDADYEKAKKRGIIQ